MVLGSMQRLNSRFLNWQICCYSYPCKLGNVNSKIIKFWRAAIYTHIATAPSSHQIYFGKAVQQDNREIFRDPSDSRKIVIKYYFVIYLITNYIQILMLSCNIYNILQIVERKNLTCRIVWTNKTYGTSFRINLGF